jgi:XTP/dITP diphosphohydrolase
MTISFTSTSPQDERRLQKLLAFDRLLTIMDELREQCPWDRKQTMESLRYLTIEETFELSDAIVDQDLPEIKQELGDILLHLVFYSRIASEQKAFDIADVLDYLNEKLVRRHPHIYGDTKADTAEQVILNWEEIKKKEKADKPEKKGTLSGVPRTLPAMVKAMRIQEKARAVGFDWENSAQVWEKVKEEIEEFEAHHDGQNTVEAEKELGDVFFALINYARFLKLNPEDALEKTNKKFIARFNYLEEKADASGKNLKEMSLAEMDVYWEEAKRLGM